MEDLVNKRFGRLVVQSFIGRNEYDNYYWKCICDCGNSSKVQGSNLKSGATKSCGCYHKEVRTKHGHFKNRLVTPIRGVWQNMMQRCYNRKNNQYNDYGGRGIEVCERWHTFENFYEDIGDVPSGMTFDRKDNDGEYKPNNWQFATWEEQNNNKRNNIWKEYNGERKTIPQWARNFGMKVNTLRMRLTEYGWSIERALTTPVRRRGVVE